MDEDEKTAQPFYLSHIPVILTLVPFLAIFLFLIPFLKTFPIIPVFLIAAFAIPCIPILII